MMALEILLNVSWITYFIPYDSIPGRLGPLVVLLLASVNILITAMAKVPSKESLAAFELYIMITIGQLTYVIGSYGYILARVTSLRNRSSDLNYIRYQAQTISWKVDRFSMGFSVLLNISFLFIYFFYYMNVKNLNQ